MPPRRCQDEFPDDPSILNQDLMLRRIPPVHFVPDENSGGQRPSSAAFDNDKDGDPMSVYRQTVIESSGGTMERVMEGHAGYALAAISAGDLRSRDQTVHSDPLADEPAHAVVCGDKTKGTQRFFSRRAVWVIPPG
jgi:hypothetical protein